MFRLVAFVCLLLVVACSAPPAEPTRFVPVKVTVAPIPPDTNAPPAKPTSRQVISPSQALTPVPPPQQVATAVVTRLTAKSALDRKLIGPSWKATCERTSSFPPDFRVESESKPIIFVERMAITFSPPTYRITTRGEFMMEGAYGPYYVDDLGANRLRLTTVDSSQSICIYVGS